MDIGSQSKGWLGFYESAWAARSEKLLELIEKKGMNPFAAIEHLNRFEGSHTLTQTPAGNTMVFKKNAEPDSDQLPTGRPLLTLSSLGETIAVRPTYARPVDFLLDYLEQNEFDAIVELGAGFGQNLIEIFSRGGPKTQYFAGEYTQSGQDLAKHLGSKISGFDLDVFFFDHKAPVLSLDPKFKRVLIFSCHTIEQVTRLPLHYFKVLAAAAEDVTAFHFEPFGYQFDIDGVTVRAVSKPHEEYFVRNGWNQNMAEVLLSAHARKEIHITQLIKNAFFALPNCPTTYVSWRNQEKYRTDFKPFIPTPACSGCGLVSKKNS